MDYPPGYNGHHLLFPKCDYSGPLKTTRQLHALIVPAPLSTHALLHRVHATSLPDFHLLEKPPQPDPITSHMFKRVFGGIGSCTLPVLEFVIDRLYGLGTPNAVELAGNLVDQAEILSLDPASVAGLSQAIQAAREEQKILKLAELSATPATPLPKAEPKPVVYFV